MNPPTIKHLNLRSIYTVLAIGFALLLFLIGLIGVGSSSKLNQISISAGKSADDYMERLKLALNIREAAAEVVSEARLLRARQAMRVWNPPFKSDLNEAKERFQTEIEKGRKQWLNHEGPGTLSNKEVEAWRGVETASQKFSEILAKIEKLKNPEGPVSGPAANQKGEPSQAPAVAASGGQQQSDPPQNAHQQVQIIQTEFFNLRKDLYSAAETLTRAVTQVQQEILNEFSGRQQRAATEIKRTTWVTLALGLLVATLTLILARNQITQLRQASRQQQEAKDFARSIFDSQSNDILVVNNDGELLAVNQAFLNHFGLPAPPGVLQDYRAALQRLPEVAAFVGKALEQPDDSSSLRERLEVKPQDGRNGDTRLFDVYASPLTIGGQTGGRVVAILDVTEAEKVREELRRSRTLSAVGQITATVAHELYNPIGAVKLNLDLLEMQTSGNGDLKHTVARLKRGVEHLSTIVMDLRHLTRTRDPERQTTDLNGLLDEVVELASDRLERSRVCVERNYAAKLPRGDYDPQQLRKVFLNLLINAVEASPQNSGVELRTRYVSAAARPPAETNGDRGELVISVIDRGAGMSRETKRRLFEAFYTTKHNGTGLGMMITQEIVKKHGGKMEVESEEGKGTTVSVYLPV
ncbi:MAG TPA: ATP-binding protein [Blastocatellia bacterium]|jgi:signal transduction histidine kinase